MRKFFEKFEPIDFMAVMLIIICPVMMAFGKDGVITSVFLMVVGFYFGKKTK